MAYERTNWTDGVTPLSATNLNNIEEGLAEHKADNVQHNNVIADITTNVDSNEIQVSINEEFSYFILDFFCASKGVNGWSNILFNDDEGANYSFMGSSGGAEKTSIHLGLTSTSDVDRISIITLMITNILNKKKTLFSLKTADNTSGVLTTAYSTTGTWNNTVDRINRITFKPVSGGVVPANTRIRIVGVK